MLGLVQLSLDMSPWGMWTVLGGAVALVATYLVSQAGQRLAADQTRQLMALVQETLGPIAP
jgi:hypothetical protein